MSASKAYKDFYVKYLANKSMGDFFLKQQNLFQSVYTCTFCLISLKQQQTTTNSQSGSRFRGVWGDPAVGNLTSTGIPTHREVDSIRPTKIFLRKRVGGETIAKPFSEVRERGEEKGSDTRVKRG